MSSHHFSKFLLALLKLTSHKKGTYKNTISRRPSILKLSNPKNAILFVQYYCLQYQHLEIVYLNNYFQIHIFKKFLKMNGAHKLRIWFLGAFFKILSTQFLMNGPLQLSYMISILAALFVFVQTSMRCFCGVVFSSHKFFSYLYS